MSGFNPRDLSISLRAVSKSQHVLNGGPKGSTFPGWFITIQQNEGYDLIAGPRQLTLSEITAIAASLDDLMDWPNTVTNAVLRCNSAMKDDLRRQLEAAEKAAERVPELRRRLGLDVADS
jgi:hypothetical protein